MERLALEHRRHRRQQQERHPGRPEQDPAALRELLRGGHDEGADASTLVVVRGAMFAAIDEARPAPAPQPGRPLRAPPRGRRAGAARRSRRARPLPERELRSRRPRRAGRRGRHHRRRFPRHFRPPRARDERRAPPPPPGAPDDRSRAGARPRGRRDRAGDRAPRGGAAAGARSAGAGAGELGGRHDRRRRHRDAPPAPARHAPLLGGEGVGAAAARRHRALPRRRRAAPVPRRGLSRGLAGARPGAPPGGREPAARGVRGRSLLRSPDRALARDRRHFRARHPAPPRPAAHLEDARRGGAPARRPRRLPRLLEPGTGRTVAGSRERTGAPGERRFRSVDRGLGARRALRDSRPVAHRRRLRSPGRAGPRAAPGGAGLPGARRSEPALARLVAAALPAARLPAGAGRDGAPRLARRRRADTRERRLRRRRGRRPGARRAPGAALRRALERELGRLPDLRRAAAARGRRRPRRAGPARPRCTGRAARGSRRAWWRAGPGPAIPASKEILPRRAGSRTNGRSPTERARSSSSRRAPAASPSGCTSRWRGRRSCWSRSTAARRG